VTTCELVMMTPALAVALLARNDPTLHRPIERSRVDVLVAAIRSGTWRVVLDAALLDDRGRLFNGQHRLTAIVEADVAVPMYLVRDAPSTCDACGVPYTRIGRDGYCSTFCRRAADGA
jgi:hypothetical protein